MASATHLQKGATMSTYYYNSPEVDRACAAIVAARDALGIPSVEVLALVAQRFGENLHRPTADEQLAAAYAELGIDDPKAVA